MPRRKQTAPAVDTPSIRREAAKRYAEVYEPAYRTRMESHPVLEVGLRELARIDVQLEYVDQELERKQARAASEEDGSAFLALESSKAPHIDPLVKLQLELRKQHGKYLDRLSLTLGRQKTLKSDAQASKLDQLAAKLK